MSEPAIITVSEFQKFREFFYRKTGIAFDDSKRHFVERRLAERMAATRSEDFRSYFTKLRFETIGDECQLLTNEMTVNETYFFREEHHFDCLVHSVLPELTQYKTPGETIRIWCMPSSSGEEPYSIAISLLERWAGIQNWDVEIIGSDIDTNILNKARNGLYSERSVRNVPTYLQKKYFSRKEDSFQLCDGVKDTVEFTRANLMDPSDMRKYNNFDVIFCRNLLIYFDDLSRRIAAQTFFSALNPGGFIFLGHSESMSRISSIFDVRRFQEGTIYQKSLNTK